MRPARFVKVGILSAVLAAASMAVAESDLVDGGEGAAAAVDELCPPDLAIYTSEAGYVSCVGKALTTMDLDAVTVHATMRDKAKHMKCKECHEKDKTAKMKCAECHKKA